LDISKPLQDSRQRAGLTWAQISERSGVGVSTLYSWLEGRDPSLERIARVASVLDITIDEIASEAEHAEQ
jgi:transcriptional regulator with XRE-family HTH domain